MWLESETWGLRSGIWESEVEVWNLGFGILGILGKPGMPSGHGNAAAEVPVSYVNN